MSILPTMVQYGPPPTLANARTNPAGLRAANPFGLARRAGQANNEPKERPSATTTGSSHLAPIAYDLLARQRVERNRVHVNVEAESLRTLERAAPIEAGSAGTDRERLVARMESFDPKLARDTQALLDFLAQQDPEAAGRLAESLNVVMGHLERGTGPVASGSAASAGQQVQIRVQQVQLAIEATFIEVRTQIESGVAISAQSVSVTFAAQIVQVTAGASDPLILDLDGNGIEATATGAGHRFDLLGTGRQVQAATVAGGDGFLALDRNGNGVIDDGSELFGDQHGASDGFAELARFDTNADGVIDAADPVFSQLRIFQDANRNGRTDLGELVSLTDRRVAAILLDAQPSAAAVKGNRVAAVSTFLRDDGSTGLVADVLLNYLA